MLDDNTPVDAIYLDFAKAFDSVPHERLIAKIEACGIKEPVSGWIRDFLVGRRQRVKVNGSLSSWAEVSSGVPQGSVLGPVLFVIFINDMPDVAKNICSMYADDTKLYGPIRNTKDHESLQNDLDKLVEWSNTWQLRFNEDKCKVLQLGNKNMHHKYDMKRKDNTRVILESSEVEKDLGVHIDKDLKFSKHVEVQVNKANKILGLIRRSYEFLNGETMKMLFIALVRPHLEFANSVWSPRFEKDKILIEGVLRRATRCVPGMKDLNYTERLELLKIPSMSYRRIRGDLIEVFKFMNNMYKTKSPFELNKNGLRGHNFKLSKKSCNTKLRQDYFSNRVVDTWIILRPTWSVVVP